MKRRHGRVDRSADRLGRDVGAPRPPESTFGTPHDRDMELVEGAIWSEMAESGRTHELEAIYSEHVCSIFVQQALGVQHVFSGFLEGKPSPFGPCF